MNLVFITDLLQPFLFKRIGTSVLHSFQFSLLRSQYFLLLFDQPTVLFLFISDVIEYLGAHVTCLIFAIRSKLRIAVNQVLQNLHVQSFIRPLSVSHEKHQHFLFALLRGLLLLKLFLQLLFLRPQLEYFLIFVRYCLL